jgi:Ca2+-transporting ATPase
LSAFYAFGGLAGLERGLRTDRRYGLSSEETFLDDFVFFYSANNNLILRDTNIRALKEEEALAPVAIATAISTWTTSGRLYGGAFADRKRVF